MSRRTPNTLIEVIGLDGPEVQWEITCMDCGGCEQTLKGDGSLMSMVHCAACNAWMGRWAALRAHAARKASDLGLAPDIRHHMNLSTILWRPKGFIGTT